MKPKSLYLAVKILVLLLLYFKGIAQRDSLLAMTGNVRINHCIDSLAKILDKENKIFLLFIHVDHLEQNAYGCIVLRMGDSLDAQKLLIDSSSITQKKVDSRSLEENRRSLLHFFNNTKAYLSPPFSEESQNKLDHDSRTFFIVKNHGEIQYSGCFYISDYTDSKNTKISALFLKLTGMMTWHFP